MNPLGLLETSLLSGVPLWSSTCCRQLGCGRLSIPGKVCLLVKLRLDFQATSLLMRDMPSSLLVSTIVLVVAMQSPGTNLSMTQALK